MDKALVCDTKVWGFEPRKEPFFVFFQFLQFLIGHNFFGGESGEFGFHKNRHICLENAPIWLTYIL